MSDLYINGASFAAGYSKENTTHFPGVSPSYATYLKDYIQPERFWNHSYTGKPPQSSVDQTIDFCELYKEKYGTTENLAVVIELTAVRYKQWSTLTSINNDTIQPVSYVESFAKLEDLDSPENFKLWFLKRHLDENLDQHCEEVSLDYIPDEEMEKYYEEVTQNYPPRKHHHRSEVFKHIAEATDHFNRGKQYFVENNINYLYWWVPGKHKQGRMILDRVAQNVGKNFIPCSYLSGQNLVHTDPGETYRHHPSREGHMQIANTIMTYAKENNIEGFSNG